MAQDVNELLNCVVMFCVCRLEEVLVMGLRMNEGISQQVKQTTLIYKLVYPNMIYL